MIIKLLLKRIWGLQYVNIQKFFNTQFLNDPIKIVPLERQNPGSTLQKRCSEKIFRIIVFIEHFQATVSDFFQVILLQERFFTVLSKRFVYE